jgi:hypothetical protein
MLTAPATRRRARSHQTQAGTPEDSSGVPSTSSEASAVALAVGLGNSVGESLGVSLGVRVGDSLGGSVSESGLREEVGDAAVVGGLDGLDGGDVADGADGVAVRDSRSPTDRVGLGRVGDLVADAVTEAVMLGVGRSPPLSPPQATSRRSMHAAAPTRTP